MSLGTVWNGPYIWKERADNMIHKIFDKNYLLQLSEKLKEVWQEAPETEPDFLEEYSKTVQEENAKRIDSMMEKGKAGLGEYPQSFFAVRKRKKWKKHMEEMLEEVLWKEPLLDIGGVMTEEELWEFQTCMKEFLRKVRKFDKNLALEDMGQAVRNYMVYAIFLVLNNKELKYRPAAFGYSMLYPYTDNYIDNPDRSEAEKEHYNRLIEDKLKGKKVKPLSCHEKKTVELLEQVEIDYGRPHEVYEGLLLMLEAQEKSLRQEKKWKWGGSLRQEEKRKWGESLRQEKKAECEWSLHQEEKLKREGEQCQVDKLQWKGNLQQDRMTQADEAAALGVSVYKGGVSVLMDRYFIDVPFTEKDLYFYYGFGFLLQLCDDLQDIVQDKEEGNPTSFSLCRTKDEVALKVNKLLHFTKELFEACDTTKQEFKLFLQKNSYLLILASAAGNKEWLEEEWLARMERWLPVPVKYLQDFGSGIFGGRRMEKATEEGDGSGKEHRNFMRMLDVLIAD